MINKKITITVVTVCKNAEKYIEETLLSVINQNNKDEKFNLEYIEILHPKCFATKLRQLYFK